MESDVKPTRQPLALTLAALSLAACAAPAAQTVPGATLPEAVRAAAAPHQALDRVELRADDGCYWYRHEGPVETTWLPLRTREGRPICTRPAPAPAAPAGQVDAPIDSSAG